MKRLARWLLVGFAVATVAAGSGSPRTTAKAPAQGRSRMQQTFLFRCTQMSAASSVLRRG
jgi:hypothetical protein